MRNLFVKNSANIFSKVAKAIFVAAIVLDIGNPSFADEIKEKSDYELQAEVVYNFLQYASWGGREADKSRSKNLCVMGDNPIIPYLGILLKNHDRKNIVVINKYENDYLEDCDILFVNDNYNGYLKRLLSRVKGKPVLTFGNIKNFATSGGIVQFTLRNNRVEFTINIREMKASRIKISDSILSISDTIN